MLIALNEVCYLLRGTHPPSVTTWQFAAVPKETTRGHPCFCVSYHLYRNLDIWINQSQLQMTNVDAWNIFFLMCTNIDWYWLYQLDLITLELDWLSRQVLVTVCQSVGSYWGEWWASLEALILYWFEGFTWCRMSSHSPWWPKIRWWLPDRRVELSLHGSHVLI